MLIKATSGSFSKHPKLRAALLAGFPDAVFNDDALKYTKAELIDYIADTDGLVLGLEPVDDEVLAACPNLKIVAKFGVGLDNLDVEACENRGIAVGWTGGTNKRSVAEMDLCFMLAMARAAILRNQDATLATAVAGSAQRFRGVSTGVRVLSQLQLTPDQLQRLGQRRGCVEPENPDVLFYTGCNVLKTPHIVLLCLDILDALEITYVVRGGPSHCCGVFQLQTGDLEGFERMALRTIDKLAAPATTETLSWCPSCQAR